MNRIVDQGLRDSRDGAKENKMAWVDYDFRISHFYPSVGQLVRTKFV